MEVAFAFGLVQEADREQMTARLAAIRQAIPGVLRFSEKHNALHALREEIARRHGAAMEVVRKRLESLQITEDHPAYSQIWDVIGKGDVLTANEYIDTALAGLPLPEPGEHGDAFRSFFPTAVEAIADSIERKKTRHIL